MKTLYFQSSTSLAFSSPVIFHQYMLRYLPPSFFGQQIIRAVLEVSPHNKFAISKDGFGNITQHGLIKEEHTSFVYSLQGVAKISKVERRCEVAHPIFKHPSPLTRPSLRMKEYLLSLNLQGDNLKKGLGISKAIFEYMKYSQGVTSTKTTAQQAFELAQGVCQDYAHIFISLARLANIPARYANGISIGEGASHAWVEIHHNGMWIGIDPTHNSIVEESHIRFNVGRDFTDAAMERGIFYGNATQKQTTFAQVVEG